MSENLKRYFRSLERATLERIAFELVQERNEARALVRRCHHFLAWPGKRWPDQMAELLMDAMEALPWIREKAEEDETSSEGGDA